MKSGLDRRIVLVVLDGCGCGASPDAQEYGDEGSHTLLHVAQAVDGFSLPNLARLGLGNVADLPGIPAVVNPAGATGRLRQRSKGKDTTTGHWELCGIVSSQPLATFPAGFPASLLEQLVAATGRKWVGNIPISGTTVIEQFGGHHMRTGDLIVYTSADSVLQIAAHEDIVPVEELYEIGRKARSLCDAYGIGRVIVRPFVGKPGAFVRTYNRRDFSLQPPSETVLDRLQSHGCPVVGIGKIGDIFARQGISEDIHTEGNADGLAKTLEVLDRLPAGLVFCNLVDFDMLYGHRRDVQGYAKALRAFDAWLPRLSERLRPTDSVIIVSDHGNDPTFRGTDHTREDVPLIAFGLQPPVAPDLGVRDGFGDVAQTLCDAFGVPLWSHGTSFFDVFRF